MSSVLSLLFLGEADLMTNRRLVPSGQGAEPQAHISGAVETGLRPIQPLLGSFQPVPALVKQLLPPREDARERASELAVAAVEPSLAVIQ